MKDSHLSSYLEGEFDQPVTPDWLRGYFAERSFEGAEPLNKQAVIEALGEDRIREAAVLIPIIEGEKGPSMILTQRAAHLKHHAGQVSFPGGRLENEDPTLTHAALREAEEEISLDPGEVEVLGVMPSQYTMTGFCITPVLGLVSEGVELVADQSEVADIFNYPLERAFDASRYELKTWQHGDRVASYFSTYYRGFNIWGATAAIILALREALLQGQ